MAGHAPPEACGDRVLRRGRDAAGLDPGPGVRNPRGNHAGDRALLPRAPEGPGRGDRRDPAPVAGSGAGSPPVLGPDPGPPVPVPGGIRPDRAPGRPAVSNVRSGPAGRSVRPPPRAPSNRGSTTAHRPATPRP